MNFQILIVFGLDYKSFEVFSSSKDLQLTNDESLYLTDFLRSSFLHVFRKKTVRKITSQRSDRSPLVKGGGGRLIMIKKRFQWRRKNEEKKLRLGQKRPRKYF